mmetsp:Transcript_2103/g.2971  ORF Transcript_2103/g.2971 Transcript_2103/m.2971 type:complete len:102 (+) Transcript_2103:115-420(+)
MIIDAKTVAVIIILIAGTSYGGLQLIRQFALSIAMENHQANLNMDDEVESLRKKRVEDADAAAASAFAKVAPLLPSNVKEKATGGSVINESDDNLKKVEFV